jgi:hypothetical protein
MGYYLKAHMHIVYLFALKGINKRMYKKAFFRLS